VDLPIENGDVPLSWPLSVHTRVLVIGNKHLVIPGTLEKPWRHGLEGGLSYLNSRLPGLVNIKKTIENGD